MVGVIVVTVLVIIFGLMLFQPKWGSLFLWPLLFAYPHNYMFQRAIIPWNIGIDDLFICVFFLIVLVRRNLMMGVPVRRGYAFWGTFVFFMFLVISNVNSYLLVTATVAGLEKHTLFVTFAKYALKGVITVLLAYSLVNTVDDLKDLRRVAFSFCFFAGLGAIIVILQKYFPGAMNIFISPTQAEMTFFVDIRPAGAFMNANNAAIVMGAASLIILCTLRLRSRYFRKGLRFIVLGIMIIAIFITRSRSGFLCLVAPIMLMTFLGKSKRYAWAFAILGIIVIVALPALYEELIVRFQRGAGESTGIVGPIALRYEGAVEVWRTITMRRVLLGQSLPADVILGYMLPHTAYLGTPLQYGIGGTIWAIVFIIIMVRKVGAMANYPEATISSLGSAVRWCLLSFALYSVVGDVFGNYYIRYTLFLLAVFAQRGFDLISRYELLYEGEMDMDDYELAAVEEDLITAGYVGVDTDGPIPEG